MINRTATTVHQYLVILWLAGLAVTVFLAGLGVFEVTTTSKLGDDELDQARRAPTTSTRIASPGRCWCSARCSS